MWFMLLGALTNNRLATSHTKAPDLSVVVVSRNDGHGGDPLNRLQQSLNWWSDLASAAKVLVEFIVVDWNPPPQGLPLRFALGSSVNEYFAPRYITVPDYSHDSVASGSPLKLFQMIGKNVGIRHARGEFILATNIEVLGHPNLLPMLKSLSPRCLYRASRVDVLRASDLDTAVKLPNALSSATALNLPNETIELDANIFERLLALYLPRHKVAVTRVIEYVNRSVRQGEGRGKSIKGLVKSIRGLLKRELRPLDRWRFIKDSWIPWSNACGDFTLAHRDLWFALRGYQEWPIFSFHLDSELLFRAKLLGVPIRSYASRREALCYHLEHGEGWTPSTGDELLASVRRKGIPVLSLWRLRVEYLIRSRDNIPTPPADWGLLTTSFDGTEVL